MAIVVLLLGAGLAFADIVENNVVVGGNDTITAGGSTTISYSVKNTNSNNSADPQNSCNPADGTPVTITLNVPADVQASTTSFTLNGCQPTDADVTFSSSKTGQYSITVSSIADTGSGTYVNNANWTLTVNAPADGATPTDSYISIDDGANWTNDAQGDVSVDISANDNVGVVSYRLAESQSGLGSAGAVPVSPAEASFSRHNVSFQLSGSEAASKAVWLRVCDAANNCADASDSIGWDKTAPNVTYLSASPAPNGAGWNNTDVAATFRATDNLSGFAPVGDPMKDDTSTATAEGNAVTVGSPAFTDLAGNTAAAGAARSDAFKIDKTAPTVSVTGVVGGATYTLGSVPAAGCSTGDGLSGVATNASLNLSGGTSNGVGAFTARCSGAVDVAGNAQAGDVLVSYQVNYGGLSGILQPINPDNSSLFSRGKAVPVKFQLAGDPPAFDMSGWKLQRIQLACTNFDVEEQVLEAVVENPSSTFRYDSTADQYINNASFKDQAAGTCWKVRVTLDSNQQMESAIFKLQK